MSAPRGGAVALIALALSTAAGCVSPRATDTTTSSVPVTTGRSAPVPAPTGPVATAPPTTTAVVTSRPCSGALRLGAGPPVSEESGEHSLLLTLTNVSSAPCFLEGYPDVTLGDAGRAALPFSYDHGGYQTTGPAPQPVALAPQGMAYVMINKYRCDLGDRDTATTLGLMAPGDTTSLTISITGLRDFSYCGPGDPGSTVDVSPVEPTADATTS